mmetsp:Transcript_27447/g.62122  ORF Transcript_27447/g.62122 Transcript_27447/m.62122 type:complete len:99 (+) Transcript_27447:103-399(+)
MALSRAVLDGKVNLMTLKGKREKPRNRQSDTIGRAVAGESGRCLWQDTSSTSGDYYHNDHDDTKQCPTCWETTQPGSHVDWWKLDPIRRQQQPSGIGV